MNDLKHRFRCKDPASVRDGALTICGITNEKAVWSSSKVSVNIIGFCISQMYMNVYEIRRPGYIYIYRTRPLANYIGQRLLYVVWTSSCCLHFDCEIQSLLPARLHPGSIRAPIVRLSLCNLVHKLSCVLDATTPTWLRTVQDFPMV